MRQQEYVMTKDTDKRSGLSRRHLLGLLGSSAAVTLVGDLHAQTAASAMPSCVVVPEQTEGPYFVDEKLHRSDIRNDPTDGSLRPGLPLTLMLRLSAINGTSCSPLAGAVVDVWHNDAQGEYSAIKDRRYDNRGNQFLRGFQTSDANGLVSFTTIYPGWYPGRTVHIHFKVRTDPDSSRGYEFTSQLYFDDAITDQVHLQPLYVDNGQRSTRNSNDRIFQRGGNELMLHLKQNGATYIADFELGLHVG